MRRRQSPASHASTRKTQALGKRVVVLWSPAYFHEDALPSLGHKNPSRGNTHPQPEIAAGGFATAEAPAVTDARRDVNEGKGTLVVPCHRELCAHRIPVARSPKGALRRREAGDEGMRCRMSEDKGVESPMRIAFRRADRPRRTSAAGKLPGVRMRRRISAVEATACDCAYESDVRIGVTGGRSPGGALRRREAAAEGTPRRMRRGSKGRSPWNAGMQGAIVQWPLARRRHNEIGRDQKSTTAFVEVVLINAPVFLPTGGITRSSVFNMAQLSS